MSKAIAATTFSDVGCTETLPPTFWGRQAVSDAANQKRLQ